MATPLAPSGTKIVTHIKPGNRGSWELNGEVGWYVGPSMHHYLCVKFYFPRTEQIRDCDTVTFFPTNVPFPQVKLVAFLKQAATDIITILTSPPSTTTPSLEAGDPVRNVLLTLATQLHRIDTIPEPVKIDSPTPRVLSPELQKSCYITNLKSCYITPHTVNFRGWTHQYHLYRHHLYQIQFQQLLYKFPVQN